MSERETGFQVAVPEARTSVEAAVEGGPDAPTSHVSSGKHARPAENAAAGAMPRLEAAHLLNPGAVADLAHAVAVLTARAGGALESVTALAALYLTHVHADDLVVVSPQAQPSVTAIQDLLATSLRTPLVSTVPGPLSVFCRPLLREAEHRLGQPPTGQVFALLHPGDLDQAATWEAVDEAILDPTPGAIPLTWVVLTGSARSLRMSEGRREWLSMRLRAAGWEYAELRQAHSDVGTAAVALGTLLSSPPAGAARVIVVELPTADGGAADLRAEQDAERLLSVRSAQLAATPAAGLPLPQLPESTGTTPPDIASTAEIYTDVVAELAATPSAGDLIVHGSGSQSGRSGTGQLWELGAAGMAERIIGSRVFALGRISERHLARRLDALIDVLDAGARFLIAAESGAGSGPETDLEAARVPGLTVLEPAYGRALDWLVCDALGRLAHENAPGGYLLRLTRDHVEQAPFDRARERWGDLVLRRHVLAGAYRLWEEDVEGPPVQLIGSGSVVPSLLSAAGLLTEQGVRASVVDVTCADRVQRAWRRDVRDSVERAVAPSLPGELRQAFDRSPVVTVGRGGGARLAWLGTALGVPSVELEPDGRDTLEAQVARAAIAAISLS